MGVETAGSSSLAARSLFEPAFRLFRTGPALAAGGSVSGASGDVTLTPVVTSLLTSRGVSIGVGRSGRCLLLHSAAGRSRTRNGGEFLLFSSSGAFFAVVGALFSAPRRQACEVLTILSRQCRSVVWLRAVACSSGSPKRRCVCEASSSDEGKGCDNSVWFTVAVVCASEPASGDIVDKQLRDPAALTYLVWTFVTGKATTISCDFSV